MSALLLQQVVNGLLIGGLYALFAVGLSVTLGVLKIFNVAHAVTLTVAAIAAVELAELWGFGLPMLLAAGALVGAIVGVLLEYAGFRPLRRFEFAQVEQQEFATLISSLALLLILQSIAQIYTNTEYLSFPPGTYQSSQLSFGPISVRSISVIMFGIGLVLVLASWVVVRRTQAGRALRAVAADPETAQMLGVNSNRYALVTLMTAGAMAGIAGVLIGVAFQSVHFLMGEPYLLKGFVVLVLGGIGSIPGTLVAGLVLGLSEGLAVHFVSSAWSDAIGFGLMIAVLMLRPHGLFGVAATDRA